MSIAIVACGAIATHISNIASRENFDLTIYPLPPLLHNHPEKIAGEVDAKISEIKDKHEKIAVAYSLRVSCLLVGHSFLVKRFTGIWTRRESITRFAFQ